MLETKLFGCDVNIFSIKAAVLSDILVGLVQNWYDDRTFSELKRFKAFCCHHSLTYQD